MILPRLPHLLVAHACGLDRGGCNGRLGWSRCSERPDSARPRAEMNQEPTTLCITIYWRAVQFQRTAD